MALYPLALREELRLRRDTTLMSFGLQLGTYKQLKDAVAFLKETASPSNTCHPSCSPAPTTAPSPSTPTASPSSCTTTWNKSAGTESRGPRPNAGNRQRQMAGSGGGTQRYVFGRAVFGAVGVNTVLNQEDEQLTRNQASLKWLSGQPRCPDISCRGLPTGCTKLEDSPWWASRLQSAPKEACMDHIPLDAVAFSKGVCIERRRRARRRGARVSPRPRVIQPAAKSSSR